MRNSRMRLLASPLSKNMLLRRLYTTGTTKVPIALIAELRKQTPVSLSKAREALSNTDGSIPAALEWLENDAIASGAAKAAKVGSRETKEGLVAQSVLSNNTTLSNSIRGALVELNCETDFVARNDLFATLAADIAHTAAFFSESSSSASSALDVSDLNDLPLIPHASPEKHNPSTTIASAIRNTILKVGENISLRRATALVHSPPAPSSTTITTTTTTTLFRLASYTHSPVHSLAAGPSSVLALLKISSPALSQHNRSSSIFHELGILERSIARQILAFPTTSIYPTSGQNSEEHVLYAQPFITLQGPLQGLSVREALDKWATQNGLSEQGQTGVVEVEEYQKWRVGEPLPEVTSKND